ncbi:NAD(P)-binding domain-containing protein [Mycobacterium sp. M23085]
MRVGFIGLGNMGFPMACRLAGGSSDQPIRDRPSR